jgi:hypothetical protein
MAQFLLVSTEQRLAILKRSLSTFIDRCEGTEWEADINAAQTMLDELQSNTDVTTATSAVLSNWCDTVPAQ